MNSQQSKHRTTSFADTEAVSNQVASLNVAKENLLQKVEELTAKIRRLEDQNRALLRKIAELQQDQDRLKLKSFSEGRQIIETEHLRSDNARLLELLRNKNNMLSIYEKDLEQGLRYLSGLKGMTGVAENLLWVPLKAYEIAHNFREQFKDSDFLSDQQIQLMLFEINKVWAIREQEQQKYQAAVRREELVKVKNQTALPYDELMKNRTISRLQNQVRLLKDENLELYANRPTRNVNLIQTVKRPKSAAQNRKGSAVR